MSDTNRARSFNPDEFQWRTPPFSYWITSGTCKFLARGNWTRASKNAIISTHCSRAL